MRSFLTEDHEKAGAHLKDLEGDRVVEYYTDPVSERDVSWYS